MKQKRKYYKVRQGKHYRIVKFHGVICHASIDGKLYPEENGRRIQSFSFIIGSTICERTEAIEALVNRNNAFIEVLRGRKMEPLMTAGAEIRNLGFSH